MIDLGDPEFWLRLLGIVLIDLSLAGDNALVIALAVRTLPARQQLLGRIWGTVGAVGLRVACIGVVGYLLQVPLLQFAGGLVLIWIAVKLVRPGETEMGDAHGGAGSLWEAIRIIIAADVTMSIDNVLAVAAAAHGDMVLVVVGIALSLPLVVWGSGLLARLMTRHGWLVWVGGGVLGYVAGEMIMDDAFVRGWLGNHADVIDDPVAIGLALIIAALGWWFSQASRGGRKVTDEA
jgi:YjbE family integral membrane protein